MNRRPRALIADDEPLLRETMARLLAQVWSELDIVALARNGREGIAMYEDAQPDICFLDVHMPGLSGMDPAHAIGRRAHLVFVTAFDQYVVRAFAEGALDYLVKPVEVERLQDAVTRLKLRLRTAAPALNTEELLQQLALRMQPAAAPAPLRWIRASVGNALHLIPVDDIDFLRSDECYTLVAWHDDQGAPAEALIRTPLRELIVQLDPTQFAQIHRSVVVNLRAVSHVIRGVNETADIHLKRRSDLLKVSRAYLHLFRQM